MTDDCQTKVLIERADAGDPHALGELLELHRERLLQIVSFRMDARVKSRVDAADVDSAIRGLLRTIQGCYTWRRIH